MDSSDDDVMDDARKQIFNEEFLKQVMQQKVAEPGMFVSNWEEEDDAGILPEKEPGMISWHFKPPKN